MFCVVIEMLFNKFKKLFIGGEWGIVYKTLEEDEYHIINLPKGQWAADPMLFEYNGVHYLFAEIYDNKKEKAGIGYFIFENDIPIFKGIVIENDYHMSYPCVFEFDNNLYMIPESSANNSVELYKAVHFPDKWKKKCVLIKGYNYVDTTVFKRNGLYFLTYEKNKSGWYLKYFGLDLKNNVATELSKYFYKNNVGRPAGYLIKKDNSFLRPAQDCSNKYGESIIFYDVSSFDPYKEKIVRKLSVSDLKLPIKAQRIHTYCEDSRFCVADYFIEKFELFHAFMILRRSHCRSKNGERND